MSVSNWDGVRRAFVLFVGTLEPRKNLARLVEALASRPGMPPLVVAGMEGWGEWQPTHAHDVRFLGFVPAHNLPAIFEAATVFAFPSLWEGYGLPVIEAMSYKTPVVTSRGPGTAIDFALTLIELLAGNALRAQVEAGLVR